MADKAASVVVARRRGLGVALRLILVVVALAAAGGLGWVLYDASRPDPGPRATDIPALQVPEAHVEPGSVTPAGDGEGSVPVPQAGTSGTDPLRAWASRMSGPTTVPARALYAYGNAELILRSSDPGCHVSWATLAGIGRVESNHGQYGGATLTEDGWETRPIIGVPLDGSAGVRAIPDTDGGVFDGDSSVDRAVGPLQFIPSTWRKWASDGSGDGRADPQQIDDAALSAARYLCAGGRNLATAAGWWAAVLSYNDSTSYAQKVFGLADGYARTAQR